MSRLSRFRPAVQELECRTTPTVSVLSSVPGAAYDPSVDPIFGIDANYKIPADASLAVGPTRMVEAVNGSVRVLDKTGAVLSQTNLFDYYFPALPANAPTLNTTAIYDEMSGRFYVFFLENVVNSGRIWYAASDTSTPNDFNLDFTAHGSLSTTYRSPTNGFTTPVALKVGYNREAVVLTMDMISNAGRYDSTFLVAIDKRSLTDLTNPITTYGTHLDSLNYGMAPAIMHNAPAGSPMVLVGTYGIGSNNTLYYSTSLRVTKMTNVLSLKPVFTIQSLAVSSYGNGPTPNAAQPGDVLSTGDTQITNAAWRNNELVAAQTANVGGKAVVRWYDINVSVVKPSLIQSGTVDGGTGVSTYFPRIEISARGDLGLSYNQSSAKQYLSVYVTGRAKADAAGTMQPPALVRLGEAAYADAKGAPYLPGSYTGIVVDASNPNSFWAVGTYGSSTFPFDNWATQLANFALSTRAANPVAIYGSLRWTYNAATGVASNDYVFINKGGYLSGTLTLVFNLTDPNAVVLSPGGVRVGNQYFVTISGNFAPGQLIRFTFQLKTRAAVPTVFQSSYVDVF